MKEILLYSRLSDYAASDFITKLEEYKNSDITIRMNTNGGSPEATFGMIAKLAERTKSTKIKVDGKANSMGAFFLAYASEAEALDVSEILIHRAAYPEWIEKDANYMTPEMWVSLDRVNNKLRAALESKIDVARFSAITNKTMDEVFSNNNRIDVILTAQQAKEIGLINEVVNITPARRSDISQAYAMAAESNTDILPLILPKEVEATNTNNQQKTKNMNLSELKTAHPDLVAAIVKEAVTTERDRAGSFLVYAHLDLEACKKGITEGATLTQTQLAEFALKAAQAQFLKDAESGSAGAVVTGKVETDAEREAKAVNDFWDKVIPQKA